jgi:hypothetical protein
MGEGLKRAKAAAEATRMTPDQMEFLRLIAPYRHGADRFRLPEATRESDRIRQSCRRQGWTMFQLGRWVLTDAGRSALERYYDA